MPEKSYDYLIIGGGLSGLQLAHALLQDSFFEQKKIAVVESRSTYLNDKTWCFWEQGKGKWDELIFKQWSCGSFIGSQKLELELAPYTYKMIRSHDFYRKLIPELKSDSRMDWIEDRIVQVNDDNTVKGEQSTYHARQVFDSRPTHVYKESQYPWVLQHFKGWVVESEQGVFKPDCFTMMDFSITHQDKCCFTYVLPFSARKALVEFTFFSPELESETVYDRLIEQYLKQRGIAQYQIEESEEGVIPMSAYPFWKANRNGYLRIGTGGGWVKASSGYSFKSTEKKVARIIANLKQELPAEHGLFQKRFHFYDRIFLSILQHENELGNRLFEEMYQNNHIHRIFRFLDQESSLTEEIKLISHFTKPPFLRALKREFL